MEKRQPLNEQPFYNHQLDRYFEPPEPGIRDWRNKVYLPPNLEVCIEGPSANGIEHAGLLLKRYLKKFNRWQAPSGVARIKYIRIAHGGPDPLFGRVPNEQFTFEVDDEKVQIQAKTVRGAIAGIVNLIHRLELERSPGLTKGNSSLRPRFARRILPGVFGNSFVDFNARNEPDERAFDLELLSGANTVMTTLDLALLDDGRVLRELGNKANIERREYLARMADRIGKHGLDLAGNCYTPRLAANHALWTKHPEMRGSYCKKSFYIMCCSHPGSIAALGKSWANLAEDIPQLATMIWIVGGEGFYHCHMHPKTSIICSRCMRKDPEQTIARFINRLALFVHQARDRMEIIAWPYSGYGWTRDAECKDLINGLDPEQVAFITCPEKDSLFNRGEHDINAWDYSISCIGPGPRFQTQERLCRKRSIPFYIKTETSLGFEFQHVPFIPVMQSWQKRWNLVRKARPKGIIMAWGKESGAATMDLGYWAGLTSDKEFKSILKCVAQARFGDRCVGLILQGWRCFSRSMQAYPLVAPFYSAGPAFLGPAHPISLDPGSHLDPLYEIRYSWATEDYPAGTPVEETPKHYCSLTNLEMFIAHMLPHNLDDAKDAILLRAMRKAERYWRAGIRCLDRARPLITGERERKDFNREEAVARWIWMTLVTSVNFIEVTRLRDPLTGWRKLCEAYRPTLMRRLKTKCNRILSSEEKNTLAALSLIRRVPELDLGRRRGAFIAPIEEMLIHKLRLIRKDLDALN